MKDTLVVVATIVAHPGKEDQVRRALLDLIPVTEKEQGFIQYDLHEAIERPGEFVFYEIWADAHSLDLHANTASMKAHGERSAPWIKSVSVVKYRRIG